MPWKILLAVLVFALIGVSEAQAERRALLVGVSKYDSDRAPTLQGPPNDVALMHDVLAQTGFDKIDVLDDNTPGPSRPTLANIRARFDALENDASLKRGDQVMIYLSGHGIQVPDLNGDETDGADEAFLPADFSIGPNAQGKDEVKGALIDDEIGAFLDKLRNKGVDVWLVMDSCFSASGARGNQPGVVNRYLSSRDLGVDFTPTKAVLTESAEASANLQPDAGKLVAFYASQAFEPAYEEPYGDDASGTPHVDGRFTAAFANRLLGASNLTYRQLFDTVIDAMSGKGQTPFVEGDGLDQPVESGTSVRQFLVHDGLTLAAGQLEGITAGTLVALYKTGSGDDADRVGQAQVVSADATSAQLQPVAASCASATGDELCAESAAGQESAAHFGRILSVPADLTLSIGHLQLMDGDDSDETYKTLAADLVTASGVVKDGIKVNLEADTPDVLVAFKDNKIWFAWPDGFQTTGAPSGVSWSPNDAPAGRPAANDLAALLQKIGKAVNIVRLATSMAKDPPAEPLVSIDGKLRPSVAASLDSADAVQDPKYSTRKECTGASYQAAEALEHAITTKQCDRVSLSLDVTTGERGMDVNVIHVDANFGIDVEYHRYDPPNGAGPQTKVRALNVYDSWMCSECLFPGTQAVDQFEGSETVIVMSASTAKDEPPFNLEGLAQVATRGVEGPPINPAADALTKLAFGGATRSAIPVSAMQSTQPEVAMYHMRILPRQLALADLAPPPADKGVHPEGPLNIFLRMQQVGKGGDTAGKQPAPQQPAGK